MSYFYFENNYGGDILFATIMKALFNVNYHKDPQWKKELLERFKKEKECFLLDGVPYPINRDREWQRTPARKREEQIRKNKNTLLKLLSDMERERHIEDATRFILIKKTVHNALYDNLSRRYTVLNKDPIGFPRWHKDHLFVNKVRQILQF